MLLTPPPQLGALDLFSLFSFHVARVGKTMTGVGSAARCVERGDLQQHYSHFPSSDDDHVVGGGGGDGGSGVGSVCGNCAILFCVSFYHQCTTATAVTLAAFSIILWFMLVFYFNAL